MDKYLKNELLHFTELELSYEKIELDKHIKTLNSNPNNLRANLFFAKKYYIDNQFEDMLEVCNHIIKINPKIPNPYFYRGHYHFLKGFYTQAKNDYLKVFRYEENQISNIFDYDYSITFASSIINLRLAQTYLVLKLYQESILFCRDLITKYVKLNELNFNHNFYSKHIIKANEIIDNAINETKKLEHEKLISYLDNSFNTVPCTKCNDNKFTFLRVNSLHTGIETECCQCKKKTWIKKSTPVSEEIMEIINNWQKCKISFEILIFSSKESKSKNHRQSIPTKVRQEVWRRDGGKCANCGSRENLEYDHIIPVSKGGSNTARNIELLCQKCNRGKSDKIV